MSPLVDAFQPDGLGRGLDDTSRLGVQDFQGINGITWLVGCSTDACSGEAASSPGGEALLEALVDCTSAGGVQPGTGAKHIGGPGSKWVA